MSLGDRAWLAKVGGALALGLLLAAAPAGARPKHAVRIARAAPAEIMPVGAFTPAAADPKLAAAFARSGLGADNFSGGAFRFTPGGLGSRRAVTVAVRARSVSRADTAKQLGSTVPAGLAGSAYSLGASVGWKRFAISGDVTRITAGLLPEGREAADIGLTYSGNRWATKLELAADRAAGDRGPLFGLDQSWSVDVGGSYAVTRNLNVTGGLRYKERRDQFNASLQGDKRESQAVYVGTAFRF